MTPGRLSYASRMSANIARPETAAKCSSPSGTASPIARSPLAIPVATILIRISARIAIHM